MYNNTDTNPHMYNQQQRKSHYEQTSVKGLSSSMVSSTPSFTGYEVKIPAISQPLISRYRNEKLKLNLFNNNKGFSLNILTDLFCGKQSDSSVSMCDKCQRSKDLDLCSFMLQLIEQKYNWRQDIKFKSTYEFYNKKKIAIFLTDQQIQYRLSSKFSTLGVILLDNHKLLLMRILKNYIKHTIYYGQEKRLTLQNDYYFWFLAGIYYHVGVPKYFNELQSLPKDSVGIHEPMMFWMLDVVMKKLGDITQNKIRHVAEMTVQYCQFFYQRQCKCLATYDINLFQIMYEWTNQAMMGYMGIQFIGFFIKSLLKQGYEYIQKTMMSYFEKRVVKLDRDEVISFHHQHTEYVGSTLAQQTRKAKKEQILKAILDSNQQWPGIFFSTNVYDFKK